MGWLENLDEDLAKNNQQSGSSGARTYNDRSAKACQQIGRQKQKVKVTIVQKKDRSPKANGRIKRQEQNGKVVQLAKQRQIGEGKINDKPTGLTEVKKGDEFCFAMQTKIDKDAGTYQQKSDSADIKHSEPIDAVALFADKVTIAGLPEAYNAKLKTSRIMFRLALILATSMIVYKTREIALQYQDQESIFVDFQNVDSQAPFPNVSICIPTYYLNYELINRWVVPERWRNRMRQFNLTMSDIRDIIEDTMLWGFWGFTSQYYIVTSALFRAAAQDAKKNGETVWNIFWPSCAEMLSHCAFDRQPFDCCQAATLMPMMATPCVQIRGDRLPNKSTRKDPMRLEDTGLTFDVSTNWTMSIATKAGTDNGYHIFIDELPDNFKVPVPVPAGMGVLLNLAEPKRVEQKAECVLNAKAPKLKYYDDYDSHGIQCQTEALLDLASSMLGCLFPMLSYVPVNESCLFEALTIGSMLLNNGAEAFENVLPTKSSRVKRSSTTMDAVESKSWDAGKGFASKDSPCKPLCSRWTYPVFSASYGSIQYRDKDLEKRRLANRTWSRIRVILPQTSSTHTEGPRTSWYVAMCDIGGMMGVYAGFSIITYTQIFAYGVYVLWCTLRKMCKKA